MKVDPMTGRIVDEIDPIRARVEALEGESWFGVAQMGASSVQDIHVTLDEEAWVVAEHVGDPDAAAFISHAPDDMRLLLERLDRVEALLKHKREASHVARRDEKWELSKGRITESIRYGYRAEALTEEADQLEAALYGE